MTNTNFAFLQQEWPDLFAAARKAEKYALHDPRSCVFYARRCLELAVQWLYKADPALRLPYQENLSALIHEPTFLAAVGDIRFAKARLIKDVGNLAVHSQKPIRREDAVAAVQELFHFTFWLARTYARDDKPADSLSFHTDLLPRDLGIPPHTREQLKKYETELRERDDRLAEVLNSKVPLEEELQRLRAEVAEARAASQATPDEHNYSEAQTRDFFIDLLLREAGWPLDQKQDREYEVGGMPNHADTGYVDYVLWGDDGMPLGLVEAKRTRRDAREGRQQAKLYADCLEAKFGQRPVIFYSNGYQHWLWDDSSYPPRAVQGFYTKDELVLLIQRRYIKKSLATAPINEDIAGRYYQTRAIRRIGESFEQDNLRKALLVMATGAGKTRTIIALCDLLTRCNWVKRVLFLADRTALVNQAVNAFKTHLPDSSPVNLVTERNQEGRVFVSTYPTMMGLIDETRDAQRRFGPGYFDIVIVDEAHRSIYRKYSAIFNYFDSYLVGLTATPKDEVDRNTYSLFNLESGVPTDSYDLQDAVRDGFLVPSKAVSIPLKFQRDGIKYDDLSDEEKEQWDELEWSEDGERPDAVSSAEINRWLFNTDTVDKVLSHLMTRGVHVAGGDRLGKTIIFAKNHDHAEFIAERFDKNYPQYKGHFARVIDFTVEYAQTLIDNFSQPAKEPHIAISVDMLDTGIDIPEIVNLVFFKLVRSKTKFWQMIGRGTRLRPDLFGPDKDKEFFYIFDWCQNLEYFSQNPETVEGSSGESLGERLFKSRVDLVGILDAQATENPDEFTVKEHAASFGNLRDTVSKHLQAEVSTMRLDNFVVRAKRQHVEKFLSPSAWARLNIEDVIELKQEIAGLPTEMPAEDEEAKRFDLLMVKIQLGVLQGLPSEREIDQVKKIAGLLESLNVPAVQRNILLIQDLQTPEWWQDVTLVMLENVRIKLRDLVRLIEKLKRKIVYTDFEDEMGEELEVSLPNFATAESYEKFLQKTRQYLLQHSDEGAVAKLRDNLPLTAEDIQELETILIAAGGDKNGLERARSECPSLGIFVRSLVGLSREAAKRAFDKFQAGKPLTAAQLDFINLIIDDLTRNGIVETRRLYESPYIDINPLGLDQLFEDGQVVQILSILTEIRQHAAA